MELKPSKVLPWLGFLVLFCFFLGFCVFVFFIYIKEQIMKNTHTSLQISLTMKCEVGPSLRLREGVYLCLCHVPEYLKPLFTKTVSSR